MLAFIPVKRIFILMIANGCLRLASKVEQASRSESNCCGVDKFPCICEDRGIFRISYGKRPWKNWRLKTKPKGAVVARSSMCLKFFLTTEIEHESSWGALLEKQLTIPKDWSVEGLISPMIFCRFEKDQIPQILLTLPYAKLSRKDSLCIW